LVAPATPETFHAAKRRKYGLDSLCHACFRADNHKWRKAHPDRVRSYEEKPERKAWKAVYNPAYYAAHREEIQVKAAPRVAAWAKAHPERMAAATKRWRESHIEEAREADRQWGQDHPEIVRAKAELRRARKLNAPGTHTAVDIAAQRKRQRGRCYYCGEKVGRRWHVDHVEPISREGSNGDDNLVIACAFCNLSKADKLLTEWTGFRGQAHLC
jgi:5-methylcytosine-specific restriction endonuclease McrA